MGLDVSGACSDTKSIGSLSQRLFESDEEEEEEAAAAFGAARDANASLLRACNGHSASTPGSKSNLLLCSECDLRSRTCGVRPQTPSALAGRYVEERFQHGCDRRMLEREDSEDSPACVECRKQRARCPHCELSETDEGDLICFGCQGESGAGGCGCCERLHPNGGACTSTDEEAAPAPMHVRHHQHQPVEPSVRIHLNNRSIEEESDDATTTATTATTTATATEGEHAGAQALPPPMPERLATIVEAKGDTTNSENDDEPPKRINGAPQPRFLHYMIVLFV